MSSKTQDVSSEWKTEIARRCREIDEGMVELIAGEDVLKEAAKELDARATTFIQRHEE